MICKTSSKAEKVYQKRMLTTVAMYLATVLLTTYIVRHLNITGWLLYAIAILPCLPVLRLMHVVALYIAEETDEFKRLLAVRSILAATLLVLMVNAFSDFLRSFTPSSGVPPFVLFCIFWFTFGIAQILQTRAAGQVTGDEE